jgi:hypothetical protein
MFRHPIRLISAHTNFIVVKCTAVTAIEAKCLAVVPASVIIPIIRAVAAMISKFTHGVFAGIHH